MPQKDVPLVDRFYDLAAQGKTGKLLAMANDHPWLWNEPSGRPDNDRAYNVAFSAAANGQAGTVIGIACTRPDLIEAQDKGGEYIAHYAARCGATEAALAAGDFNIGLLQRRNRYGLTPRMVAEMNQFPDTARAIKAMLDEAGVEEDPEVLPGRNSPARKPAPAPLEPGNV